MTDQNKKLIGDRPMVTRDEVFKTHQVELGKQMFGSKTYNSEDWKTKNGYEGDEWGFRWFEIDKNGKRTEKEKFFKSEEERERFMDKTERGPNFDQFSQISNPTSHGWRTFNAKKNAGEEKTTESVLAKQKPWKKEKGKDATEGDVVAKAYKKRSETEETKNSEEDEDEPGSKQSLTIQWYESGQFDKKTLKRKTFSSRAERERFMDELERKNYFIEWAYPTNRDGR